MKITIEHYEKKFTFETPYDDLTTYDVLNEVKGLMFAATWLESGIIEGMRQIVEEYDENKKEE